MTDYQPSDHIPNLYQILGLNINVCDDPKCDYIIQKAYIRKAKLCHPDKHPGKKEVEELFELITSAYDILKSSAKREKYNYKLKLKSQTGDYFALRKSHQESLSSTLQNLQSQDKIDFKKQMDILNEKNNANFKKQMDLFHEKTNNDMKRILKDRELDEESILHDDKANVIFPQRGNQTGNKNNSDKKLDFDKAMKNRQLDDQRFMPDKIFDGVSFDPRKFNAAFDYVNNKDSDSQTNRELKTYTGQPSAWNESLKNPDYIRIEDTGKLCTQDSDDDNYFINHFNQKPTVKLTAEDLINLEPADYVDGHNNLGTDYYKQMKEKLNNRKNETFEYGEMSYSDFSNRIAPETDSYLKYSSDSSIFDKKLSISDMMFFNTLNN